MKKRLFLPLFPVARVVLLLMAKRCPMSSAANSSVATKCCYCGMIKDAGRWHDAIEEVAGLYSHGCCPRCEAQVLEQIGVSVASAPSVRRVETGGWTAGHARRAARASADAVI